MMLITSTDGLVTVRDRKGSFNLAAQGATISLIVSYKQYRETTLPPPTESLPEPVASATCSQQVGGLSRFHEVLIARKAV